MRWMSWPLASAISVIMFLYRKSYIYEGRGRRNAVLLPSNFFLPTSPPAYGTVARGRMGTVRWGGGVLEFPVARVPARRPQVSSMTSPGKEAVNASGGGMLCVGQEGLRQSSAESVAGV
jgi:hypothetical protein